jgi:hypothetical protein
MKIFTKEEVNEIFDLAYAIESMIDGQDFTTVFNALLVVLANGGRNTLSDVSQEVYLKMITSNIVNWSEFLDYIEREDQNAETGTEQ